MLRKNLSKLSRGANILISSTPRQKAQREKALSLIFLNHVEKNKRLADCGHTHFFCLLVKIPFC